MGPDVKGFDGLTSAGLALAKAMLANTIIDNKYFSIFSFRLFLKNKFFFKN
jgi:hypothetical protein